MISFEDSTLESDLFNVKAVKYPSDENGPIRDVKAVVAEMSHQGVGFVHARVLPSEASLISALVSHRFYEVGELWSYEAELTEPHSLGRHSPVLMTPAVAPELAALAANAFSQDRFHRDPKIEPAHANELKRRWALNNLNGRAQLNFGVLSGRQLLGFIQCFESRDTVTIDLVAVAEEARGHGVGKTLVAQTVNTALEKGIARVVVGTQSDNHASQALYSRYGFARVKRAKSFHWHQ